MKHLPLRLLFLSTAIFMGCDSIGDKNPINPGDNDHAKQQERVKELILGSQTAALSFASDCDEARDWLKDSLLTEMEVNLENNRQSSLHYLRCYTNENASDCWRDDVAADGGADMAGGEPSGPSSGADNDSANEGAPEDYSDTNLQTEGVDEADRVKTDGEHIYLLSDKHFVIVDSWPADELSELSRIELPFRPQSFYLKGDKAIVLGSLNLYETLSGIHPQDEERESASEKDDDLPSGGEYDGGAASQEPSRMPPEDSGDAAPYRYHYGHGLSIIDISQKESPRLLESYYFDGYGIDSRRIDSNIYLIQNNSINLYDLGIRTWIDSYYGDATITEDELQRQYDELLEHNKAKINALDLDTILPLYWKVSAEESVSFDEGEPLFQCDSFAHANRYSGLGLLGIVHLDLDSKEISESSVLGSWGDIYASQNAIYIGSTNYNYFSWLDDPEALDEDFMTTQIHKFDLKESGKPAYAASGEVKGYALNQFAYDEYNAYLRVATTTGNLWWGSQGSESRVTVLKEENGRLNIQGEVTGLGKGEQIYGVRFIGEQAYVVTFRQIDPLYVIDLQNPQEPKVTGELEIPGYSSYIHPLEPGYLLTAGAAGNETGLTGGVKIEIFDVRDPAAPKSVKSAVVMDGGWGYSEALYNHKAFVYFASKKLLAIPVSGWTYDEVNYTSDYYSRLFLFKVSLDDIEEYASISHLDVFADESDAIGYYCSFEYQIYRGVFIEDYIYSISQSGVAVHDVRDMSNGIVSKLVLSDGTSCGYRDAMR